MKKIICEVCSKEFFCNYLNVKKCWCYKIPTKKVIDKYIKCICDECLNKKPNFSKKNK